MLMQNTMMRQAATQNAMLNYDLALGNRYAMGVGLGYPAGGIPMVHPHVDPYYSKEPSPLKYAYNLKLKLVSCLMKFRPSSKVL
jgi:hypothetical protein